MKLLITTLVAGLSAGVLAQSAPDPAQVLAQRTRDLGACNIERGQLQVALEAPFRAGQLVEATKAHDAFLEEFERANPGKTLVNMKIADKPKSKD